MNILISSFFLECSDTHMYGIKREQLPHLPSELEESKCETMTKGNLIREK